MAFQINSVTPHEYGLYVTFNAAVLVDAELINIENYSVAPNLPASAVYARVISVSTTDDVTTIDVETTDYTDSQLYTLTIVDGKLQDIAHNFLNIPNNTAIFVAVSTAPVVQRISAIDDLTIEVEFSKEMSMTDLDDRTKYVFDKGLSVISVTVVSNSVVQLTTSKQTPSEIYTLVIAP